MTSTMYDEDLNVNPFFVAFKTQQKVLFDNSLKKSWIIAIPRVGTFNREKYDDFDFLSHVLVPVSNEEKGLRSTAYKTLGNQNVIINGKMITISKENDIRRKVSILFDETYYTDTGIAYKLVCIDESLSVNVDCNDTVESRNEIGRVFTLNSVEDSKSFLWKIIAKQNTRLKVDALVTSTISEIEKMNTPSVPECFAIMKNLYVKSYSIITSHKTYKKVSSKNENVKNSLKLALEMYLCHNVRNSLFSALTDITAEKDEEVNKSTRRHQDLCASKSGIRFDMCENIPRAKKELSSIRLCSTPLGICECIRKVIADLSSLRKNSILTPSVDMESSAISSNENIMKSYSNLRSSLMVTSDDLLSALIFLIVKSEIPNWYSYLEYASHFRFASCSRDDEYQYYLTTLEAALEHIRNMESSTIENNLANDISTNHLQEDKSITWKNILQRPTSFNSSDVMAYELNQTRHLFQLIESGQTSAVKELLERSSQNVIDANRKITGPGNFLHGMHNHSCHPLCRCTSVLPDRKSCVSLISFKKPEDSQIMTVSKTFDSSEMIERKSTACCTTKEIRISCAATVNSLDDRGWSAIHVAAACGKLDILSLILSYEPNINGLSMEGESAIHVACRMGHQDIIMKLIDSGADINIQNFSKQSALHLAVENGYSSCVSALVCMAKSNLNINIANSCGNTALHVSAMWGYESITKCLLDYNASTLIKNKKGLMPHDIASTKKLSKMIKCKAFEEFKMTSEASSPVVSKILEKANNNLTAKRKGYLPLKKENLSKITSSTSIFPDVTSLKSCDTDMLNRKVEKLLKVVADGDIKMLRFLLEISEDDDMNSQPINTQNSLCHPLCQCERCYPLQQLIIKSNNQQLNVNSANKEGFRCMHIAAIHDRSTIAKFLLHHGADANVSTNKMKLYPLHLAAIYGSIKVLSILMSLKDVQIDEVDAKMNTAFFYSCMKGKLDAAELLFQAGASVNVSNHRGNTPLHEAVRSGCIDIVSFLINKNANVSKPNSKGLSPLDLAKDLNIYLLLRKVLKPKNSSENCDIVDIMFDTSSVCSETSLSSSDTNKNDCISSQKLFHDEISFDFMSLMTHDNCDSPSSEIDEALLERVDRNSKYNYRLMFRDPNSPSVSSTNSSK